MPNRVLLAALFASMQGLTALEVVGARRLWIAETLIPHAVRTHDTALETRMRNLRALLPDWGDR